MTRATSGKAWISLTMVLSTSMGIFWVGEDGMGEEKMRELEMERKEKEGMRLGCARAPPHSQLPHLFARDGGAPRHKVVGQKGANGNGAAGRRPCGGVLGIDRDKDHGHLADAAVEAVGKEVLVHNLVRLRPRGQGKAVTRGGKRQGGGRRDT